MRPVLNITEGIDSKEIAAIKSRILANERTLKTTYFDEVGSREGKARWEFIKDFNKLISGEASVLAALGAAQKDLVDEWSEEDFEEMEVTREEVMQELEYEEVLIPLSKQHDDIETRKRRIRGKIAEAWEEEWEIDFDDDDLLPPWQSKNFLQQLSYLASEFPQDKALAALKRTKEERSTRQRSRNTKFLTVQDVKDAITLMQKEKEEESSSEAVSTDEEEDDAHSSAESDLPPRPSKRPRTHAPLRHSTPDQQSPVQRTDDAMTEHLKGKWAEKATNRNLEAVKAAVRSLTHEAGEKVPPSCIVDRLILLKEYLRVELQTLSEGQWAELLEDR